MPEIRRWYLTPGLVMGWGPCPDWTSERVEAAFRGRSRMSITTLLRRADIPGEDRLWVVLREGVLSPRILRHFACDCAERALLRERERGREPDPRSWRAVEVARRYADGLATDEELAAARDAAGAAWDAAWAAAWDAWVAAGAARAARAAWVAAGAAARAARDASGAARDAAGARATARAAEREWQCAHLAEMIRAAR